MRRIFCLLRYALYVLSFLYFMGISVVCADYDLWISLIMTLAGGMLAMSPLFFGEKKNVLLPERHKNKKMLWPIIVMAMSIFTAICLNFEAYLKGVDILSR